MKWYKVKVELAAGHTSQSTGGSKMIRVIEYNRFARILVGKRVITLCAKRVQELFGEVRSALELQERIYDMVGEC